MGVPQVFLMLTSGGEPLQLTNDEGDKDVDAFSSDGKEVYYARFFGRDEVWAVPTLGGTPHRGIWQECCPLPDGASIFYVKSESFAIYRAGKSGLNEELVYNPEGTGRFFIPLQLFPDGKALLAAAGQPYSSKFSFYRLDVTSHKAIDLGEVTGGNSGCCVGGTWRCRPIQPKRKRLHEHLEIQLLKDRSLTQITFGVGPDYSPMPGPGGIYYVNGKSSDS